MAYRRSIGDKVFDSLNVLLMVAIIVATLYPILYVAFSSISAPSRLIQHSGPLFYPLGFSLGAYKLVARNPMIAQGYMNTLLYVVLGTAVNITLTSLGAYGLSRKKLLLKNPFMFFIVFTMFFQGGLIPLYLTVRGLGLVDNRLAMILPVAVNVWNLIIMRTSFLQIPVSIEESAHIDGANDFVILLRIVLPLSIPVVAVMILFYGVQHWNSFFSALIYLRTRLKYPLQMVLREILISNDTSFMLTDIGGLDREPVGETVKYATIVVSTVPILLLYPFLQRYFIQGIMIGALKG